LWNVLLETGPRGHICRRMPFPIDQNRYGLTRRHRRIILVVFIIAMICVIGYRKYRFHDLPRAVATITDIWVAERKGRMFSTRQENMAVLKFTRFENGRFINCEIRHSLGLPSSRYAKGDKLLIVPASDSCDDLDILGVVR
jgi:hypothetical protein